jgi:hypothetical protein
MQPQADRLTSSQYLEPRRRQGSRMDTTQMNAADSSCKPQLPQYVRRYASVFTLAFKLSQISLSRTQMRNLAWGCGLCSALSIGLTHSEP